VILGVFASFAGVLAAIGIYGVLAYGVVQRTQEIGLRMALGAQGRDVLRLIVTRALRLAAIGTVIGLVAALALTRLMQNLLFGVSASDPLTFLVIALVPAAIAILASAIPALRAARIDPLEALRYE